MDGEILASWPEPEAGRDPRGGAAGRRAFRWIAAPAAFLVLAWVTWAAHNESRLGPGAVAAASVLCAAGWACAGGLRRDRPAVIALTNKGVVRSRFWLDFRCPYTHIQSCSIRWEVLRGRARRVLAVRLRGGRTRTYGISPGVPCELVARVLRAHGVARIEGA
jgi:hypothetical protein